MGVSAALGVVLLVASGAQADWRFETVAGAGGVPLNVVTAGSPEAPPLLLIHGIGQSHYSFVHQMRSSLAQEFYLVAFDLRGHGSSGKPWLAEDYSPETWADDVAAVIDATGIDRPTVVAWSYGSVVILDYIRKYGTSALSGLNLVGSIGGLRPFRIPEDAPDSAAFLANRKLQASPNLLDNIEASERVVQWLTAEPVSRQEAEVLTAVGIMLPRYARDAIMQRDIANEDLVDRLNLPVLLSVGGKDSPVLKQDADSLAGEHPHISVSFYPQSGHSVFYEQPRRFNTELRAFASGSDQAK